MLFHNTNLFFKCPFCGEDRRFFDCIGKTDGCSSGIISIPYTWYGKACDHKSNSVLESLKPKNWFKPNHHYEIRTYKCYTCGSEWQTPPYPTDIISVKEANEIYELIKEDILYDGSNN